MACLTSWLGEKVFGDLFENWVEDQILIITDFPPSSLMMVVDGVRSNEAMMLGGFDFL